MYNIQLTILEIFQKKKTKKKQVHSMKYCLAVSLPLKRKYLHKYKKIYLKW